ncbi:MAG: hypothetical protein V1792_02600 [Pseudomonadota bacterium]
MTFSPNPRQVLALWRMLFTGEEPMQSTLAAFLGKNGARQREELVKAGLLELEKRGMAHHVLLTDRAWAWAGENLDSEISMSKFAAPVLQALLVRMKAYMENRNISLAEILVQSSQYGGEAPPDKSGEPDVITPEPSDEMVEQAYRVASSGRSNVRVRLAKLRELLRDLERDKLDTLLISMQQRGKLTLYSLDDPQEIDLADEKAAIDVGGFKRHIVYMGE